MSNNPFKTPNTRESFSAFGLAMSLSWFHVAMHLVLMAASIVLWTAIVPSFCDLFEEFGLQLTMLSQIVVGFGHLGLIGLFAIVVLHVIALATYLVLATSPIGKRVSWMCVALICFYFMLVGIAIGMPLYEISAGVAA